MFSQLARVASRNCPRGARLASGAGKPGAEFRPATLGYNIDRSPPSVLSWVLFGATFISAAYVVSLVVVLALLMISRV